MKRVDFATTLRTLYKPNHLPQEVVPRWAASSPSMGAGHQEVRDEFSRGPFRPEGAR